MIFIIPMSTKKRRDMVNKLRKLEKVVVCKNKNWRIDDDEVKSKKKKKKKNKNNINRILISINIVGSSGPLTMVVNEDDAVCDVIEKSLKSYARQGRLPILGSDVTNFDIYCSNDVSDGKFVLYDLLFFFFFFNFQFSHFDIHYSII